MNMIKLKIAFFLSNYTQARNCTMYALSWKTCFSSLVWYLLKQERHEHGKWKNKIRCFCTKIILAPMKVNRFRWKAGDWQKVVCGVPQKISSRVCLGVPEIIKCLCLKKLSKGVASNFCVGIFKRDSTLLELKDSVCRCHSWRQDLSQKHWNGSPSTQNHPKSLKIPTRKN